VACVDYSVAKGGPLAAYRYDGESECEFRRKPAAYSEMKPARDSELKPATHSET
jgi:hypothetical protein